MKVVPLKYLQIVIPWALLELPLSPPRMYCSLKKEHSKCGNIGTRTMWSGSFVSGMEWVSPNCQTLNQHEHVKLLGKKRSKQLIKPRETWIQRVRNLLSHERYRCLCGWFQCFRNLNSFRLRSLQNANKYHIPQAKSLHTSLRYWLGYMHSPVTLKNIAHRKRPKKSLKYFLH